MTTPPRLTISDKGLKLSIVDRSKGEIVIVFQDGRVAREQLIESSPPGSTQISKIILDWDTWSVAHVTNRGDIVMAEAYSPSTEAPLRGRRSVYLDQNHWSTVGTALTNPARVQNKSELRAALEIVELARSGVIVLPVSAAHLRETAALHGDRRYEVGVAMAELSSGWQFRHPTSVWRNELIRALAEELSVAPPASADLPVITLEPHALLDDDISAQGMESDGIELFVLAVSGPSAILDHLIDPKPTAPARIPNWVARQEEIAGLLRRGDQSKGQKRSAAYGALWADNLLPTLEVLKDLGIDLETLPPFSEPTILRVFQSEPMLRYFSQLMTQRLINSSTRWREMILLICYSSLPEQGMRTT